MHYNRRAFLTTGLAAGALSISGIRVSALSVTDLFPVVETSQGKLRGLASGGVYSFKGVRYAASTAGNQRFRSPSAPPSWVGIRDAIDYGQVPPQGPDSRIRPYAGLITFDLQPGGMGEDCLVLNISTPTLDRNAKRPVLFHLHGGGFSFGSANTPVFDGESLARFGDCIVVVINHRLGAFGYLDLADQDADFADSGTVGMQDITAALRWVTENIANFGGDPTRVLVFGQSGGGAKTSTLMAMPSAKGLFRAAGVMSGSLLSLPSRETSQVLTHGLLQELGIKRDNAIKKLQALSFQQLLAAQLTITAIPGSPEARAGAPSFAPCIDGTVIPGGPFDPAAPATSRHVPMIIGSTLDEMSFRFSNFDLHEAGLLAHITDRVGESRAAEVLGRYREEDPKSSPFLLQSRLESDAIVRRRAVAQAERKAAQAGAPVWSYLWALPSPAFGGRYGATHATDLGPSFHDPRTPLNGATSASAKLADQIAACWVTFAATGNPNNSRIPHWEPYDAEKRSTIVFDTSTRIEHDPRPWYREFWQEAPA